MQDFSKLKPREVESYLREQVRKIFGDKVENLAEIYSTHGYYNVEVFLDKGACFECRNFRKTEVPKIVAALKALKPVK